MAMIEVDIELVEEIVKHELYSVLNSLQKDYRKRKSGAGISIFDRNKDKDLAEIDKHIQAFKLILKYYGE